MGDKVEATWHPAREFTPTTEARDALAAILAMSYGSHVHPPKGGKDWRAADAILASDWLADVKAEAWDEGSEMGYRLYATDEAVIRERNPYRQVSP